MEYFPYIVKPYLEIVYCIAVWATQKRKQN